MTHLEDGYSSENWEYGFSHRFDVGGYDSKKGWHFSNTAKTVGGLFALDVNQSIWAMSWQLISRFTWESFQTVVGLTIGIVASELGLVEDVSYERGATKIRYKMKKEEAFTVGSFISGKGLERGNLLEHEYGHTIQSRIWGPLYIFAVAIPSLINYRLMPRQHREFIAEKNADNLSKWYGF